MVSLDALKVVFVFTSHYYVSNLGRVLWQSAAVRSNLASKVKKSIQNDLAVKERILSSITRCFMNALKTQPCQRKEKFRVTISMWMLLHKQAFKRQSAACAQNETATIKCLWPDVHQSVVF